MTAPWWVWLLVALILLWLVLHFVLHTTIG